MVTRGWLTGLLAAVVVGCATPPMGPVMIVVPEPSLVELTRSLAEPSVAEDQLPQVTFRLVHYPEMDTTIQVEAYAATYFDMAGSALPALEITRRDLSAPVTLSVSSGAGPGGIMVSLPLINKATVQYLAQQASYPTINGRVTFYGHDEAHRAIQYSLNVPVRMGAEGLPSPSSPTS